MINFLFLLLAAAFAGDPPASIKGQEGSIIIPSWNLEVPYNQATPMGGINALIETGNGNILANPGFEGFTTLPWIFLGTATIVNGSSINPVWEGKKMIQVQPGNRTSGDIVQTQCQTPGIQWQGVNVETSGYFEYTAAPGTTGDQGLKICAVQDGAQVYCEPVNDKYINRRALFSFVGAGPALNAGSAVPMCLQVIATQTKNFGIEFYSTDENYIGKPRNLGQFMAGGQFFGGMTQVGASGCNHTQGSSTGNFVDLGSGSGCNAWVTSGSSVTSVGTNSHQITLNNMGQGRYLFVLGGQFRQTGSASVTWRLSDGTSTSNVIRQNSTNDFSVPNLSFEMSFSSPGTRTFKLQAADDQAITNGWYNDGVIGSQATWSIFYFPDASLQAIRADQTDYTWGDCPAITGSWSTNTTYVCKMMGQGPNVWFNISVNTSGAPTAAALTVNLPFTVDTSKLAQGVGGIIPMSLAKPLDVGVNEYAPGYVRLASSTSVDVRINAGGTPATTSSLSNVNPFTFGSGDSVQLIFAIPVVGRIASQGAPQLVNGVYSKTTGTLQTEYIRVATTCSSNPCTITDQSGAAASVNYAGSTGSYTVTWNADAWRSAPSCTFTVTDSDGRSCRPSATTTSTLTFNCVGPGPTAENRAFNIECKARGQ